MVARIGTQTWTCDCCGLENDQRGCVKGPPTCDCYYSAERAKSFSFFPDFCSTCGRCKLHCPGSPTYEAPDDHPFARYRRGGSEYPINKTPAPHPFRTFGFCHCEDVKPEDLKAEREYVEPDEYQPGGPVNKIIHTVCAKWYMPVDTAENPNDVTLPSSKEQLFTLLQYADSQARTDLARKVLHTLLMADTTYSDGDGLRTLDPRGVAVVADELRELFQREGVNIEQESSDVTE